MDINCPRCAEPWDISELHDTPDELSYDEAHVKFFTEGCGLTFGTEQCEKIDSLRADASALMYELLGDDIDGIASMMEDFDYTGAFDG